MKSEGCLVVLVLFESAFYCSPLSIKKQTLPKTVCKKLPDFYKKNRKPVDFCSVDTKLFCKWYVNTCIYVMNVGSHAWAYMCVCGNINTHIIHSSVYACMNLYMYTYYALSMYTFRYLYRQTNRSVYCQTYIYVHTYTYYIHACEQTFMSIDECMYVHKYTYKTYICMHISTYVWVHICINVFMYIYVAEMYIGILKSACVHKYEVCIYLYMYADIYICMHTHTMNMHAYINVYVCIYVYMYVGRHTGS